MYRDNTYTISISLNKKLDYSAPIMFVPAYVPSFAESFGGHGKTTADRPATAVMPVTKKPVPAAKAADKPVPKKAPTVMAAVIKKPEVKPVPSSAKALADMPVKKEETKPTIKPEPAPIIKKEVAKIEPPTPIKKDAASTTNGEEKAAPLIPENAHVSDNYREVEALRRHAQLQNEIIKCWKPPFGVSPAYACDISFSVSTTGAVQDIVITKSSGVLMYDISARQALYAMTMPKWTYGKQLIINFKQ